ncbi:hypothetical protein ACOY9N_18230 [Enterobacter bugandensis]|uniref:hypothetical protein n=1 Tax=Enterobacter bugandensis TaxID=881260 RepID=UPI003BC79D45
MLRDMPWRRASRILFAITIEPGPEIGTEAIHSPLPGFSSGRHHSVIFATLLSKKCSENPNVINCWIANNSHKKKRVSFLTRFLSPSAN